jgi:hypothetical protein
VPDGHYAVWVCSRLCGADTGFGDLVYGRLTVARDDRPGVGDVMPLAAFEAGGIDMAKIAPWLVGSIAVIGAVSATVVVTRRRPGRSV